MCGSTKATAISFNGAALREGRNPGLAGSAFGYGQASMGPPSEKGGIPRWAVGRVNARLASMGPPSEKGGIIVDSVTGATPYRSFNGAALREGRNHEPGREGSRSRVSASMGPPSEKGGIVSSFDPAMSIALRLQWGRPPRRAESG